jgi:hypothetical protein
MSEPHQKGVVARCVDHHHVVAVFDRTDGSGEVGDFLRLVGFDRAALGAVDTVMRRQFELNAPAFSPGAAVLNM